MASFTSPENDSDENLNILELFSINSKSGVIQTAQKLDREELPIIRLKVLAIDKGSPPFTTSSLIEINILDTNDNSPVFVEKICKAIIVENTTVPIVILTIKASDADSGNNGIFFFFY